MPTVKMDLVADDCRGPSGKRVKWVEDFDLEPQTPGIMTSRRMRAADVQLRSTPSSPPPSSTTSIHRLGSPTCWPACRIIPPSAFTNSCLGTGALRASLTPPERNRLSAQSDLTRGRRRMRTLLRGQNRILTRPTPSFDLFTPGDRISTIVAESFVWLLDDLLQPAQSLAQSGFEIGNSCITVWSGRCRA